LLEKNLSHGFEANQSIMIQIIERNMNAYRSDCHVVDRHMVQMRIKNLGLKVRSLVTCPQAAGLWAGTMDCHVTQTFLLIWMWRRLQYWARKMLPAFCLHPSTDSRLGSFTLEEAAILSPVLLG
jgi:hypothetical protein